MTQEKNTTGQVRHLGGMSVSFGTAIEETRQLDVRGIRFRSVKVILKKGVMMAGKSDW